MAIVQLNFNGNRGYGADQVVNNMTLDDFIAELEEARDEWGGDAKLVMHQSNARYGANFGNLSSYELFSEADIED